MKSNTQSLRNHGGPAAGTRPMRVEGPAAARDGAADRERVRARAYEIFRSRQACGACGDAVSDWLTAEREVNGGFDRHAAERGDALLRDRM